METQDIDINSIFSFTNPSPNNVVGWSGKTFALGRTSTQSNPLTFEKVCSWVSISLVTFFTFYTAITITICVNPLSIREHPRSPLNYLAVKISFWVNYFFANLFNSARAQFNLSFLYMHGLGVKKNTGQSVAYLQKSVVQNYAPARQKQWISDILHNYSVDMVFTIPNYFSRKNNIIIRQT